MNEAVRMERDTFGEIAVPADRLWGAQTERSLQNFRISTEKQSPELIHALAIVKRAAAAVNQSLGVLADDKARAIIDAADEIIAGKHPREFPLAVWQTSRHADQHEPQRGDRESRERTDGRRARRSTQGSSERRREPRPVVERRLPHRDASRPRTRSSTTCCRHCARCATLDAKSKAFADIVKIGRTHLQDATPLTLGKEFSGYVAQLGQHPSRRIGIAAPVRTRARRHRGRHGAERASGVRGARRR